MIEPYITEKQCRRCKECKPITEFHYQATSPGGRKPNCKSCTNARQRALYGNREYRGMKRNRNGKTNPPRAVWEVPTHDYSPADIAWQSTRIPPPPVEFRSLGVRL